MIGGKTFRRLGPAAIACAALLVLAATASGAVKSPSGSEAGQLKVGLLVPLTGALAQTGSWIQVAAQYAVSEINKKGGVRGQKVTLVTVDDAADPTQDVAGATKLITQDHVNFIMGPITSGGMIAVTPFETRSNVAAIGVVGSPRLTPDLMPYGFSVLLNAGDQARRMVQWAAQKKYSSVAILHDNGEQGLAANDVLNLQVGAHAINLTGDQQYTVGASDMTSQLIQLKNGNPQALLLFPTTGTDTGRVLLGMQQLNWDIPVIGGYGAHVASQVAAVAGQAALSKLVATDYAPFGKCGKTGLASATKSFTRGIQTFNASAFQAFQSSLDLTASVRDGLWIMKRAMEGAKSTKGDKITAWLEKHSNTLGKGLVNGKVGASAKTHFLFGPSDMVLVRPGVQVGVGVFARADC